MIYLYLKGKDTPYFVRFYSLYYVHFKKLVFHLKKTCCLNIMFMHFFAKGTLKRAVMNESWYCNNARPSCYCWYVCSTVLVPIGRGLVKIMRSYRCVSALQKP